MSDEPDESILEVPYRPNGQTQSLALCWDSCSSHEPATSKTCDAELASSTAAFRCHLLSVYGSGSLSDKVDLEQCDLAGETEPTMERLSKVAGCSNHGQGQGTRRVGRH